MVYKKVCEQCGKEFETNRLKQKYCGFDCRIESRRTGRTEHTKICPYCGNEFTTIVKAQKYCSAACASRFYADQIRGDYYCEYCGKPRHSDHPNRNRFCSVECAAKALHPPTFTEEEKAEAYYEAHHKTCPVCGNEFDADNASRIYCSDECKQEELNRRARENYAEKYEPVTFECAECGKRVTTECGDTRRVFCSEECCNRYSHRKHRKEYKRHRREQMKEAFVEQVGYKYLFNRAKGMCEICGLPVPEDKSPENTWGGTCDHIKALSVGGLHMKSNCQLAHRMCNSVKDREGPGFKIDWMERLNDSPERWENQVSDLFTQVGETERMTT